LKVYVARVEALGSLVPDGVLADPNCLIASELPIHFTIALGRSILRRSILRRPVALLIDRILTAACGILPALILAPGVLRARLGRILCPAGLLGGIPVP